MNNIMICAALGVDAVSNYINNKRRQREERERREQKIAQRLINFENKGEPTPEEIEQALANEEAITIHHNHELVLALKDEQEKFYAEYGKIKQREIGDIEEEKGQALSVDSEIKTAASEGLQEDE